jgi:hypothetical protein
MEARKGERNQEQIENGGENGVCEVREVKVPMDERGCHLDARQV